MEEKEEVILIGGIINATGKMLFWKSNIEIKIGDYAIVENMKDYDLIKVVGIVHTTKERVRRFSNTSYENMKKIIKILEIE